MGDISENFSRSEFACKCGCGFATVDVDLLKVLEVVRKRFKRPVKINSACRCNNYNEMVGGSQSSKHKQGIAADIVVAGVKPYDVYLFLDGHMPNNYGIGVYKTFTHIDIRMHQYPNIQLHQFSRLDHIYP
jgi:uncharacterized protein YcbK (DUF882 family)